MLCVTCTELSMNACCKVSLNDTLIHVISLCANLIFVAAYEGWACAATAMKYDLIDEIVSLSGMQRTVTMTTEQIRSAREIAQHGPGQVSTFVNHLDYFVMQWSPIFLPLIFEGVRFKIEFFSVLQ